MAKGSQKQTKSTASHMLFLLLIIATTAEAATVEQASTSNIAKPGCRDRCGNVSIPYPFGMKGPDCYFNEAFRITCNDSIDPPRVYMKRSEDYYGYRVLELTLDYVRISPWIPPNCYHNETGESQLMDSYSSVDSLTSRRPLTYSTSRNKFMAIGCDIFAYITIEGSDNYISGCASFCVKETVATRNLASCSGGNGCCETSIPKGLGLKSYGLKIESINTYNRSWIRNPCSRVFTVDKEFLELDEVIRSYNDTDDVRIPVIMDWAVGHSTCEDARKNSSTSSAFACGNNTSCVDSNNGPGYRCECSEGYRGNPYLLHGCQDINECKESSKSLCHNHARCINTEGSYNCACPHGYEGDGRYLGTGCTRNKARFSMLLGVSLGIGIGILFITLIAFSFWIYHRLKKRNQIILKQNNFKRNGGLLLKQRVSTDGYGMEKARIFDVGELRKATDNFNPSRIVGKGGFGTVYKGMLSDGRIVAIKKSKLVDQNQVDQFINELVILSNINHRHIVKLLGCCLETQVPLLVYEFVSRGTLLDHIRGGAGHESKVSWTDRLRIAAEVAGALEYLHSDASTPIFHRDIKSSNILLDENYNAKVSDFGISRSIPLNETHVTTLVQGTFGYLDPEYFHSSRFTEKSDVYSFGVVLAELLTGEGAVFSNELDEKTSLVSHFISSLRHNRLSEILDDQVTNEADKDEVLVVCKLAKRCLKLNGHKRPTMKEVSACLNGLRRIPVHPWDDQGHLDAEDNCLISDQISSCETSRTFDLQEFEKSHSIALLK